MTVKLIPAGFLHHDDMVMVFTGALGYADGCNDREGETSVSGSRKLTLVER